MPRLYAAGIIPGLLIAGMLAIYVMWRAKREGFGEGEPFDGKRFLRATIRSLWALGAPVIILGGIYGGVFSPTEAAAVACVYAAFVTAFVFRELCWRDIVEAAASTVLFTGADPDHRGLRRRVRLAADRESGAGGGRRLAAVARRRDLDAAARDQRAAAAGRLLPRSAVGDPAADPAAGADRQGGRASTPCISASW